MNILIIGCGRVGARLAQRLASEGHQVSIIDDSREAFLRLGANFAGNTYQGSGLDDDVLRRAGVERTDLAITVTGGDNRNLMIAQLLKQQYGVKRSIARLHDPVRAAVFEKMGVETICTTTVVEGLLAINTAQGQFPELPGEIKIGGDDSALHAF